MTRNLEKTLQEATGKTMLTDLYQLTMDASYLDNGKADDIATFDLFVRKLPQDWGYFIVNGIEDAIDYITNLKFEKEDIDYLKSQNLFSEDFLNYLKEFKFEGEMFAIKEGTPIGPNVPLLRVKAKRGQAQFVESALLNIINFQTMLATKANRIVHSAEDARVVDFGLRRAQGEDAAMKGARAAYIAGCVGTSNVKAGKEYGIPISGTHAHSFVMSFASEIEAFRAYAKTFPNNATLLIDTYDTLEGARNAAIVAKELEKQGKKLGALRLDSGDIAGDSKRVRELLDDAGLRYVKILASNDLNEYKIQEFKEQGARIDAYGVGTEMITAKPVAAIAGVYKLVEDDAGAKIKLSPGKKTYPAEKQLYRVEQEGKYLYDILALEGEEIEGTPLLEKVVENGKRIVQRRELKKIREYCLREVAKLPEEVKRLKATKQYEVRTSEGLDALVSELTDKYRREK